MEVQVFYSYQVYNSDSRLVGHGSGSMTGEKEKIWTLVMDNICKDRMCEYKNIHLISFNTI